MKCNSIHIWSDARCCRQRGHDGYCWSRSKADRFGVMVRAVWWSENGKFKSHHAYEYGRISKLTAKEVG
jgi:hypothetical protein